MNCGTRVGGFYFSSLLLTNIFLWVRTVSTLVIQAFGGVASLRKFSTVIMIKCAALAWSIFSSWMKYFFSSFHLREENFLSFFLFFFFISPWTFAERRQNFMDFIYLFIYFLLGHSFIPQFLSARMWRECLSRPGNRIEVDLEYELIFRSWL